MAGVATWARRTSWRWFRGGARWPTWQSRERPAAVEAWQIIELRERGLTDSGVHDAVAVVAYFNFANRLVEGLHIPIQTPTT